MLNDDPANTPVLIDDIDVISSDSGDFRAHTSRDSVHEYEPMCEHDLGSPVNEVDEKVR